MFSTSGMFGDCSALRTRVQGRAGDRGRRAGGGAGDAVGVRGLQPDTPLVCIRTRCSDLIRARGDA